jgi:hypothetical protein
MRLTRAKLSPKASSRNNQSEAAGCTSSLLLYCNEITASRMQKLSVASSTDQRGGKAAFALEPLILWGF